MKSTNFRYRLIAPLAACSLIFAATLASAAEPYPLDAAKLETIKKAIKEGLKDPYSAQFKRIEGAVDSEGGVTVCGYVNAKNSFGGYVGYQPFWGFAGISTKTKKFVFWEAGVAKGYPDLILEACRKSGLLQ